MTDVMLDLETWGTKPGCAIRSIGAVVFDPHGAEGVVGTDTFYRNILDVSCESIGLTRDPGTVAWWDKQSSEARDSLLVDQRQIADVVVDFGRWWSANGATHVWAQGSNFDPGLWEHVTELVGRRVPWKFYDTRDTRTVYHLAGLGPRSLPSRAGTYHNALDDAIYQARCVQHALARIKA